MIAIDHGTLVTLAKYYGLIYLIVLSIGVLAYTFWPSNKARFDRAANSIMDDGDAP